MRTEGVSAKVIALDYVYRGWSPIPIPFGTKKPILEEWQNLRISEANVTKSFGDEPQNIGILLGEPSGGLIDIDLDAPETIKLAPIFLPPTNCRFGRPGKPDSHWLYLATPSGLTSQYRDTEKGIEESMLVEYRSTGAQTVFPGSTHNSGEIIEWTKFDEPLCVKAAELKAHVARLAAAALVSRHWPAKGSRNAAALALAGGLLRSGWEQDEVETFIHAVGLVAGDEETLERIKSAGATFQKIENDNPTTGWPALADLVGERVVNKVRKWLGLLQAQSMKLNDEGAVEKISQATALVGLTEGVELWHSPDFDAYVTIEGGGHGENYPLISRAFKQWLSRQFYLEQGKAAGSQAVQDALSVLGGKAIYEGAERQVYNRLAGHEGKIYLDLANREWEVVEIDAAGWKVVSTPRVKFRRTKGMLPVPHPVVGGDINTLRRFVNVSNGDWPLLLAWLVAALRHVGPYPVLVLNGEHGSAKSTTGKVLRRLVDPNKADLRAEPKDPRDLMIAATNGLVIAIDNISHIPTWLSDALCRLATGGGFSTRTLYENDEEMIFDAQRPVILNGINEIVTRGDLLDRALTLVCPVIPEDDRRTEEKFWEEFEQARPVILGALLTAVSHAMAHVESTKLERLPRMADFAVWAVAAEPALGLSPGKFFNAYTGNRELANELVLDSSPVAVPLVSLIQGGVWEGSAAELLSELNAKAGEKTQGLKSWPKNARSLSSKLRTLAPNLRAVGIDVEFDQSSGSGSKRILRIRANQGFSDASDACDATGTYHLTEFATQSASVATPDPTICDAPHAPASQGVASVAEIPTHSKSRSGVWEEHL